MKGLVLSTLLALCLSCTGATLPGFKLRVTMNGINYGIKLAETFIIKEAKTMKIPDQSGKADGVSYTLSNIQIRSISSPTTGMTLTPDENGVTLKMSNLDLTLFADWKAHFIIHERGTVDISLKDLKLQLTIKVGDDGHERPNITVESCSGSVSDVSLDFHGGASIIINLLKGIIDRKVRSMIDEEMCPMVKKEIDEDGNNAISKLKTTYTIIKKFVIDYGLLHAPTVQTDYLETEHKPEQPLSAAGEVVQNDDRTAGILQSSLTLFSGEVFWVNDTSEAPFPPKPFATMKDVGKMGYLWLSDYVVNSMAYVAQKHNFLRYLVTSKLLPEKQRSMLNTTCSGLCIGTIIPQIGSTYPNAMVEIDAKTLTAPKLTFSKTSVAGSIQSQSAMYARTQDGKSHYMFTLAMNVSMALKLAIVNEQVIGAVVSNSSNLAVLKSTIKGINATNLNGLVSLGLDDFAIPMLNKFLQTGLVIPVFDNVKLENTMLTLDDGSVMIGTNLKYEQPSYSPSHSESNSNPLKFNSNRAKSNQGLKARQAENSWVFINYFV